MDTLSAMTVLALVYAIGDVVALKTRAVCSMMFVSALILMVGFWCGLPTTVFTDSALVPVSMAFISVLMIHMGSMLNVEELKEEWRTVAIALIGICAASAGLYVIAAPLIGKAYAIAAAGPISGGVVSTLVMTEAAKAKGLPEALLVFLTLLMVLQNFVGIPIASWCLLKEGQNLKVQFRNGAQTVKASSAALERKTLIPQLPRSYQTPFILIAKTFMAAWLSVKTAALLGNVIHPFVMAMLFGIVLKHLGALEPKVMDRANSGGMVLFTIMVPIFMSLDKATPAMVMDLLWPIAVAFAAAVAGILIAAWPVGKLFGYSWFLTTALSVPCLFGFPATYIISNEVATQLGDSEEEREFLLSRIMPKMLISGFTSVTIASVILAGFLVRFM